VEKSGEELRRVKKSEEEQRRAEKSREEQRRAEKSREEQSRTEQNRAEQSRSEQAFNVFFCFILLFIQYFKAENHRSTMDLTKNYLIGLKKGESV
jgi:hypothetical protein